MKNYIIYLPGYTQSRAWADRALTLGQSLGWDLELFPGVDGSTVDWDATGITINQQDAKCRAMMHRPGVRGCFLSHWQLWNRCVQNCEPLGIFEHDIEFLSAPPDMEFEHVLRLEGFLLKKPRPAGAWYEGARAYILKPAGAELLINWVQANGALPADVNLGLDIVDTQLGPDHCVKQHALYGKTNKRINSFTWNLNQMEKQ
jgi:hypothetical protein